uniref:ZP domain-containing protein n=1 Tax=Acrobeloides nanus TaxID=290746 RepID=A0A914CLT6_9BILA
MTKFTCQIRLCMKNRDKGCENLTPPSKCPTPEEREAGMTTHEEGKNAAVEKGSTGSETDYAGPSMGVGRAQSFHGKVMPPGLKPNEQQRGESHVPYSGYRYGLRNRRELTIIANASNASVRHRSHPGKIVHNNSNQSIEELDVEEVIRVLDSPEDVLYYEEKMRDGLVEDDHVTATTPFGHSRLDTRRPHSSGKCMSTVVYWSLLGTFTFLITIQAIALGLFMMDKWLLDRAISNKFRTFC